MKWRGLFALMFLSACTSVPHAPNRFVVEKRWVRGTLEREHLGSHRQHRFKPLLFEDLVIAANSIDGIVAYDRKTVATRWRLSLRDGVEGGAIIVGNDLLFGASDGFFYAVNARTGEVRWTYPIRSEGLSVPYAADGVVYFVAGNNVLNALSVQTGKLLWVYTRRDPSNLSIRGGSQPSVAGDSVYVGFSDGYLVSLKKQAGSLNWEVPLNRNKRFRDVDAHPVLIENRIYVSSYDGALYCLNRDDGKIIWSIDDGGEFAVTVDKDRLYYATSTGQTLAIDRESGKILWRVENKTGIGVQPVLIKKLVLAGEMGGPLRFLDPRSGETLGQFESGWGITATPNIDPKTGDVFIMTAGANLYALHLDWQKWTRQWPWE